MIGVNKRTGLPSAFALRLYESRRSHAKIRVSIPGAKKVSLTNFLEEEKQVLDPWDPMGTLAD